MADVLHAYIAHNLEAKNMYEEPIAKIKLLILPAEGEYRKLQEEASADYAKIITVNGAPYIVLPYRTTWKCGAYRRHFIRPNDYIPETAFKWRFQGWEYIAFPHSGQRIISVYKSNRGIVRVQLIEPSGKTIRLGETIEEAVESFVISLLEIYENGEVHKIR
jgi:hypothetical protein